MPKLYLIDGNAYVHRAYHALPPLTTSRGEMVNAVYGFVRMLLKLLKAEKPEYIAVCFDYPAKNFRHEKYAAYKANRKAIDDELKTQMPLAREAARVLGLPVIEVQGYEADDSIATMARAAARDGADVVIVSGDKDALQLVNDHIRVWNESKNTLFEEEQVKERYGLAPAQLVDMFALMGDASDNVPGIRGVGEKTAVKLLQKYGSLERLLAEADTLEGKIKTTVSNGREDALKSRFLVTLEDKVPVPLKWSECVQGERDEKTVLEFLSRMEFNSLAKEILPEAVVAENRSEEKKEFSTNIVTDSNTLEDLVSRIKNAGKLSLDLETTGVDPLSVKIVGVSLAVDTAAGWYIPVGHDYPGAPEQLPWETVKAAVSPLLQDRSICKYGQNIKYDYLVLKCHGIGLEGIHFDTMVASYCLNPSRTTHNLKSMAIDYLGLRMTEIEELIGKGAAQITMNMVSVEKAAPYAAADAVAVLMLAEKLAPEIKEKKLERLFFETEMPLLKILAEMEYTGIKVDVQYLRKLEDEFASLMRKLEMEIFSLAGQEFNPNSPKQLGVILFEKLQLPVIRRTKTGYCTDEEVLRQLSLQHMLPQKLIDYRELQKLKSTYIDALLSMNDTDTHRVHTSFNQTVTATGRLSSSGPNLQNIPIRSDYGKMIRGAFIPADGYVFLSADYSQIDLRVLAHVSNDAALVSAFRDGGDIHSATAREVFNITTEEVPADRRRMAKSINFGIVYGISPYGLAQQLKISNEEAKVYIKSYFDKYKGVEEWIKAVLKDAKTCGYVTTLLGRIRYLPDINASNGQVRAFAERMAMNTPIQGTSADIIKVAMITLARRLQEKEFKTKMLVQVHDELLFEVPEEELSPVSGIIKEEMENAMRLRVPVIVDLKTGRNWAEMKTFR